MRCAETEVVANVVGLVRLRLVVALGHSLDFGTAEVGVTLQVQCGSSVGGVGLRLDEGGVAGLSVDDLAAQILAFEFGVSENTDVLAAGVVDDEFGGCKEGGGEEEDE